MKLYLRLVQFFVSLIALLLMVVRESVVKHSLNLQQFLYISFSSYPKIFLQGRCKWSTSLQVPAFSLAFLF